MHGFNIVSNINELPRPDIVRSLLDNHYGSSLHSSATSSHWKHYSEEFKVEVDPSGEITALQGAGFGDYRKTALRDRVLDFLTVVLHLAFLPLRAQTLKHLAAARSLGCPFGYDTFRQSYIAATLSTHMPKEASSPVICLIGDGYGVLTSLLKFRFPKARFLLVDLGKVLLFQNVNLQRSFPKASFSLVQGSGSAALQEDFTSVPAESVQGVSLLENAVDLVVNVASMQEMTREWIAVYFKAIRRMLKPSGVFYCCNREEKKLTGGEVIRFKEFPWLPEDYFLFLEEPRYYRWFLSIEPTLRRLRLRGLPVPFGRMFDGKILHGLIKMAKSPASPVS